MTVEAAAPRSLLRRMYDWCIEAAAQAACDVDDGGDRLRRKLVLPRAAGRDADPDVAGAAEARLCHGALVHDRVGRPAGCSATAIGALLYDSVGSWLIQLYGYADKVEAFRAAYAQWGAWIILLKGLTPIPYKIVTITSGFAGYNLGLFLLFSIITRGARFFVLAFLLHRYGERARHIIEKRLGLWMTIGAAMLVVGIVAALYFDLTNRRFLNFAIRAV